MTQPLTHARIGYDSIGPRGTVSASGALAGYPASAAANPLTYSFWSAGLPSTWEVALTSPELCNYFGVAAHTLHSNHVVVVMQAFINAAWETLPVLTTIGDLWDFNGDLYGKRGAVPGATSASLRRGTAADGQPVLTDGVRDSKFGQYAMTPEPATSNLFPENVRTCGDTDEDLTDFNAGSSTASYDTDHSVNGAGSILINNGASAGHLLTSPYGIFGLTDYTISLKVATLEATGVGGVGVSVYGNSSGLIDSTSAVGLEPGQWITLDISFTTGVDTNIWIDILVSANHSIWVDDLQLETGDYAHTWVNGSRAAANIAYQPEIIQQFQNDMTVNCWLRLDSSSLSLQDFFSIATVTGGFTLWAQKGATSDLAVSTQDQDGNFDLDIIAGAAAWDGGWHMVSCVLKPEVTGADNRFVYFDGRLIYSDESPYFPDWQKTSNLILGWGAAQLGLKGYNLIDDLTVINRAATLTEIRSWYDSGEAMSLVESGLPAHDDDRPIMRPVEAATSNRFRLKFVGESTPQVGVIYMGKALEMQRALYGGHTPINLARSTVIRPNVSSGGQFVGRSIIRAGSKGSWAWSNLTAAWVREYLDPFVDEARTTPFFMLWRPSRFPGEAGYCWTAGDQAPSNMGKAGFMAFSLDAEGLGVE